ncbi:MAG: transglutaminase domain-containing protein, partial [Anaerolineae bacterium]|nr:transglutaminase domain-containing protein [Anaerolineae bacterium]
RWTATFAFNLAIPIATLYTPPHPIWVSRPAQANLAYNPDGTADLAALHAAKPLRAGETYQARSSLSTATIAQLRTAGADYPLWVTDRYLQIPSTVTTRTLQLARQITSGMDNPYDIAAAVTAYLRTHIQYSETVPPPPPDQEPLDWFLFDLRQGFCSYYASTEVILLRSLGIPARLAVGFAQGERQDDEGEGDIYLVRQRDAHTWPEVYFSGLGWVEFEPTASQSPIYRSLGEGRPDTAAGPTTPYGGGAEEGFPDDRLERVRDTEFGPASDLRKITARWNLFLALGLILLFLAWRVHRRRDLPPLPVLLEGGLRRLGLQPPPALRRWARRVALAPLERAYLELNHALVRLDAPPDPADTPAE